MIIAAIVLLAVPVRHAEAVANGFSWHWSVRVGTRVWVGKKSKRKPIGELGNWSAITGPDWASARNCRHTE